MPSTPLSCTCRLRMRFRDCHRRMEGPSSGGSQHTRLDELNYKFRLQYKFCTESRPNKVFNHVSFLHEGARAGWTGRKANLRTTSSQKCEGGSEEGSY